MFVDMFKIQDASGKSQASTDANDNITALTYKSCIESDDVVSSSNNSINSASTATPSETMDSVDVTSVATIQDDLSQSAVIFHTQNSLPNNQIAINVPERNRFNSIRRSRTYERSASLSYFSNHDETFDRLAVAVNKVHLSYGSGKKAQEVLRGINLRVPEGAIYGLLGPSGCGKTTLLNAVIGRFRPKTGVIRVFGKRPGSNNSIIPGRGVGYMPQELALYPEFTIEETLVYFGRLHQIDSETLKESTEFLLKFLDLPTKTRLVQNLSGGQQRRVSLAAALIHRPPLLVLDEPTVGVDPLLRQNIWNHLVKLTSEEGMTVIITTHYIEEARQADVVGLMRKGRLLAEASPTELMKHYEEPSLEECFLKLCMMDKETKYLENKGLVSVETSPLPKIQEDLEIQKPEPEVEDNQPVNSPIFISSEPENPESVVTNNGCYAMSSSTLELIKNSTPDLTISLKKETEERYRYEIPPKPNSCVDGISKTLTLFSKNMTRLRRNIAVVLFQFALPAIQVILLCLCIGRNPFDLPIAVFNEENPPSTSKLYLEAIDNHSITQKTFHSLDSAIDSVKRGETWGAVHIGPHFSNSMMERYQDGLDASNETITNSSIKLYLDMTNQQIALTIQKTLLEAFQVFASDLLAMIGSSPLIATLPIVVDQPVYGVSEVSFTEFIAPGVILSITYILAVGLTALSFVQERNSGLFDRSWVSGVTSTQVLTSHMMTQSFVLIVQVFGLLIFTFLVFDVPSRGPFIWVVIMTLLQGVCGMTFGLLISAMVKDENTAVMIAMGSFYPNLILSGIVWPLEGQPYFVRYLSVCLPQTLPTEALRAILSRGWGLEYDIVWTGFVVTLCWIAFFIIAAGIVFRIRK